MVVGVWGGVRWCWGDVHMCSWGGVSLGRGGVGLFSTALNITYKLFCPKEGHIHYLFDDIFHYLSLSALYT